MPGRGWSRDAQSGPGPSGLLPWQMLLLAASCGILALRHPLPGLTGLGLVWLAAVRLGPGLLPGRFVRVSLLASAFVLALGYAWLRLPASAPEPPEWMARGDKVAVTGVVAQVQSRYGDRLRVVLDQVRVEREGVTETLPGRLALTWREAPIRPEPGQEVGLYGRVWPIRWFGNPGADGYDFWWRTRGAYWRSFAGGEGRVALGPAPASLAHSLRQGLLDRTRAALPDTQGGAMVRALLFGDRLGVDEAEYELLSSAGLAHTLARSGLHIGFVVLLGFGLARLAGLVRSRIHLRIPRQKLGVLLAAPLVLGYLWLGEPSPSLVRAAVMFAFWGALLLMGRRRVLMDGLFLAALLILAATPLALFDLRFQLSVLAVAGIGLAMPWVLRLERSLRGPFGPVARPLGWILALLAISLAANLATLPLTVWYFGRLAPNLLANVVWLPLLGLAVMPPALCGLILLPLAPGLGSPLLCFSAGLLDRMLSVLHHLAGGGAFPLLYALRPWWPSMLGLGLVLVVLLACPGRKGRGPDWVLALAAVLLLLASPVAAFLDDVRDEVRLAVLDVGKGQALLVTAPGGVRWLVDGGGSMGGSMDTGQAVVGPCLAYGHPPRLDGAVLTHPHLDHYQGVVWLLNHFRVAAYADNGRPINSSYKQPLLDGLARNGLDPVVLARGDRLVLNPDHGADLVIETLHPARSGPRLSTNDSSLVLRLVWRGRPLALLPGDVEKQGIGLLLGSGEDLSAEVLVLPHHGSEDAFVPDLYRTVAPGLALASMAWGRSGELPAPTIRTALEQAGAPLMTTADQGLIEVRWQADRPGFVVKTHRLGLAGP